MPNINSFAERTSELLISPALMAEQNFIKHYYHNNGKDFFCFGTAGSALLLAQAVVSIAAVPIQILAGIFSSIQQFSRSEFKEGIKELKNGLVTSSIHAVVIPLSALASIGVALYIISSLPYSISTWNTNSEWWSPA